jgi:hypothetical protein
VLGLTFVVFFMLMEVAHGKNYYVFPIYPMVFAGGGVVVERWLANRAAWTRAAVVRIIVLAALPAIPLVTWMLPPEKLLAYQNALGLKPAKTEMHHESLFPQPIADQFGWPEMANEVAGIYNSLPPDDRAQTGIWAWNYGEAGAINLFGPKLGLPPAYSRHQNHLVLGSAATGLQESHCDPVEPRRCARQLHFISGLRPLRVLWHGRGKHSDIPLPRCQVRYTENLVALAPLELRSRPVSCMSEMFRLTDFHSAR